MARAGGKAASITKIVKHAMAAKLSSNTHAIFVSLVGFRIFVIRAAAVQDSGGARPAPIVRT
jgi:hypothetical protein